jgi:hypothetical protein
MRVPKELQSEIQTFNEIKKRINTSLCDRFTILKFV